MKSQRIFIVQIAIAILVFSSLSYLVKYSFYKSADVESYLNFDKGIQKMAKTTKHVLDSLIDINEVTFDPTSAKNLDKVFKNLKNTRKDKFLMIGSSQLRVVKDIFYLDAYSFWTSKLIDKKLMGNIEVYNLSLGNMTTLEKIIVAKKAQELLKPKILLLAATPWDSQSDKVRNTVKGLEKSTFVLHDFETTTNEKSKLKKELKNKKRKFVFPTSINTSLNEYTEQFAKNNLLIYGKRTAINRWLKENLFKGSILKKQAVNESLNMPALWITLSQDLNNSTGWDYIEKHTGDKSAKIINSKLKDSRWEGEVINLKVPVKTLIIEGWSKSKKVSRDTKLYCLDLHFFFEDGTSQWYLKDLSFKKGTNDWSRIRKKVIFNKKVVSIKPHLLFYGGTGTVWFDDISITPVINGKKQKNIVPNSGFEDVLLERKNVSYIYDIKKWELIKDNMFKMIDWLSNQQIEKPVFLMTPFWQNGEKSAYPQKETYQDLIDAISSYCDKKNVIFLDASNILTKDNFGIYTQGSVRDKIDVLHFDAKGNEILANFIIKELDL